MLEYLSNFQMSCLWLMDIYTNICPSKKKLLSPIYLYQYAISRGLGERVIYLMYMDSINNYTVVKFMIWFKYNGIFVRFVKGKALLSISINIKISIVVKKL